MAHCVRNCAGCALVGRDTLTQKNKEDGMGDLLDIILDMGAFHDRYGNKGCAILLAATLLMIGLIIAIAYMAQ